MHFSRWWPRPLNTSSGFVFVDASAFRRSKSISKPNFIDISQLTAEMISTSVFENQTSAILEIYFQFRFRPFAGNLHIILHLANEFRRNRSIHCKNMTSYPFLKIAAATAKYYFRFPICWCQCLQKVKVYQQTRFRRDISIGGWDLTISGFEIQTSAILEFYFRFWSRPFRRNRRFFLHPGAEFRPNRNIRRWNVMSIFKMAAVSHVVFALA